MYQLYRDRPLLVLCMIIANAMLSAWCLYLDPVINFDGVTYLNVAQLLLDGQLNAAFEHYSWPFYSLFTAITAKLLILDVETAAVVLNTILATSLTLAFVCVVSELSGNNKRVLLIAMAVILLFPSISKYRSFIIRDFGYLSCYLWSLYFIFRFCATIEKKHLIGWLFFACLSTLFRFEGIVFILIAPYFLFLFSSSRIPHKKKVLALMSGFIAFASIALLFWYINDKYMDSVEVAKATGENIQGLSDLFFANIQERLGQTEPGLMSFAGLLGENTMDVAYELTRRMAFFYALFAAFAYFKGYALNRPLIRKIWLIYLIGNLIMLIGFSLFNNFLVSRYTMATALTLLILAPFAIDRLITIAGKSSWPRKLAIWSALAIVSLVSIEGLNVRTKKMYVKQAGEWLDENAARDARIYSNNKLAVYYSNRHHRDDIDRLYSVDMIKLFMQTGEIRTFDYLVLIGDQNFNHEDLMLGTLTANFGPPIKSFEFKEDRYAHIYYTAYDPYRGTLNEAQLNTLKSPDIRTPQDRNQVPERNSAQLDLITFNGGG